MAAPNVPTPHPQFYYTTGDLVLQAERTLFKIPQAVLLESSPVLKAMIEQLNVTNATSSTPQIHDECPILYLPDKAHEWHDMFCLLLGPNYLQQTLGRPPWRDINKAVNVLGPLLRVSFRYRMTKQRADCIAAMKQVIPSEPWPHPLTLHTRNEFFPCLKVTPRQLIVICREVDLQRFLPWAFYECARSTAGEITTFTDLGGEDRAAILAGRDVVIQMQRQQIYRSFTYAFVPDPACTNSPPCQMDRGLVKKFDLLITQGVGPLILVEPDKIQDQKLCPACLNRAKMEIHQGQHRLWENLPQIFGLGTWSGLYSHDELPVTS